MHVIKSHPVAFSPPVQNNTCLQDTDNNPSPGTMKPTWPRISDYKSFSLTDAEDSPKMSTKDSIKINKGQSIRKVFKPIYDTGYPIYVSWSGG